MNREMRLLPGPLAPVREQDSNSSRAEPYAKPAVPELRRSPRPNPSLKENLSQWSSRLLSGRRGIFPGQLDGGQRDDGARRGAPRLPWNRITDLRAQRGREKCRHTAAVTNGPGLFPLSPAVPIISHAGRPTGTLPVVIPRAFFIPCGHRVCPGLVALKPVEPDAFTAARLALPLLQVEVLS